METLSKLGLKKGKPTSKLLYNLPTLERPNVLFFKIEFLNPVFNTRIQFIIRFIFLVSQSERRILLRLFIDYFDQMIYRWSKTKVTPSLSLTPKYTLSIPFPLLSILRSCHLYQSYQYIDKSKSSRTILWSLWTSEKSLLH